MLYFLQTPNNMCSATNSSRDLHLSITNTCSKALHLNEYNHVLDYLFDGHVGCSENGSEKEYPRTTVQVQYVRRTPCLHTVGFAS